MPVGNLLDFEYDLEKKVSWGKKALEGWIIDS
jgi:hypothetical protein